MLKRCLFSLALLAFALSLQAATTNVTFRWDQNSADTVSAFRLYEIVGGNRVLLSTVLASAGAQQPPTSTTISNWQLGSVRTVICTASNVFGESPASAPLTVPPGPPSAPLNLMPIPLSIVVPVPGTTEISTDLVDWRQRIHVAPTTDPDQVLLTWSTHASEPIMFMRSKAPAQMLTPPIPGR